MSAVRLSAIAGLHLAVTSLATGQPGTDILPRAWLATEYLAGDTAWYQRTIPFFECSDPQLTRVYYYRWRLYKSHLRDLGERGYIVTEFLDDVPWATQPYQSLDDATAFHIEEGRWLRDDRYLNDYIAFMYSGANRRHFSDAIAAAVYDRYLVNRDRAFALKNLEGMKRLYEAWADHYDRARGLYFIEPLRDATEYSIASIDASGGRDGFHGGTSFRPTINSFMFGNATAISKLAALAGDEDTAQAYAAKAANLKQNVQSSLWNDSLAHFGDRYRVDNRYVHSWAFIRGRELAGYAPWAFELPDNRAPYAQAWSHVLMTDGFLGTYGLRTVEPSYPFYLRQFRYAIVDGVRHPECQWNGPSWPFDTALVLRAAVNLLNDYTQQAVTTDDFVRLLKQYARQHFLNGELDLQEDSDPDTGRVIVGMPRSHHYNHSEFNDLIITGLVGLRPCAEDVLEVNPLIPASSGSATPIDSFCLENAAYHGHNVTILFDRFGDRYRMGKGLQVYVDGRQVLPPSPLGRKRIAIPAPRQTSTPRPLDLAVNLSRKGFPAASASANNTPAEVDQAIDGRIWFYPQVRNYWSNAGSAAKEDWFCVDFGSAKTIHSVQLSFYDDGAKFRVPEECRVQGWMGTNCVDLAKSIPKMNTESTMTFPPVATARLRLLFPNPKPAAVALVEIKAFD